ncbi:MAG: hypothetical protein Q8O29_13445 [Polaromonas sp.]|uniref:hypothetical protein n=1 Tax=Polaromonas sp. TaxID=1869339 RepID=UPI002734DEA5|nr:hypothetical protein [Polaromonas sp.]MDP2819244.1 hypothetical protein [Polaromonas sp.]
MNRENKFRFPAQAARSLGNIRTRTWLILGAVGLLILGLMAWAGIAILFWLWGQEPGVSEAGKRLAGEAVTQIEKVAPGLKEQVGQWLPGLGEAAPVSDVSGTDIGPVPRFPGLVRSHFAREGQAAEVRYAGRAAFDTVLAHYVQGFAAANYAQEVLSATSEGEQHRFRRGQESIDLSLLRGQGGMLELRLKLSSQ